MGLLGAVGASLAVFFDGLQNSVATGYHAGERGGGIRAAPRRRHGRRLHARKDGAGGQPRTVRPVDRSLRRAGVRRALHRGVRTCHRRAGSLSVAFLDFDGLKQINDGGGHAAGDAALIHLAKSAQAVLRPTDLLSRVGGDEFVLLLPDTDYDEATAVVRRIQGRLAEADGGEPASVTAGLVTWHSPPESIDKLFVEADALMYSAKRTGGDRHLESQVIG